MIHFHEGIIGNVGLLELISNFYLDLIYYWVSFYIYIYIYIYVQELIF